MDEKLLSLLAELFRPVGRLSSIQSDVRNAALIWYLYLYLYFKWIIIFFRSESCPTCWRVPACSEMGSNVQHSQTPLFTLCVQHTAPYDAPLSVQLVPTNLEGTVHEAALRALRDRKSWVVLEEQPRMILTANAEREWSSWSSNNDLDRSPSSLTRNTPYEKESKMVRAHGPKIELPLFFLQFLASFKAFLAYIKLALWRVVSSPNGPYKNNLQ